MGPAYAVIVFLMDRVRTLLLALSLIVLLKTAFVLFLPAYGG
ncbi:hypothetical protein [Terricaulis sp.]